MTRSCPVCAFDNTPLPGTDAPTHCESCGTPLRPDPDDPLHSNRPAPGHDIRAEDDAFIVTDAYRDHWPELEDVLVIHELLTNWGQGIGAEPYGYVVTHYEAVEIADDPCPECGSEKVRVSERRGEAKIAGSRSVECNVCAYTISEESWA